MCGITGILSFKEAKTAPSVIKKMTDAVSHRGPDADGFFIENEVALGHRRLSIIDLSSAANQPFIDNSGRYVMVFNGEMYNYAEVKNTIRDYSFRTNGDSEVLIAAYAKWGAECIKHFRGMFAFAIWDRHQRELLLCRDRMGVKPLYYFVDKEKLLFSSELRSILASNLVHRRISTTALMEYFSYQSVSCPYSVIEGIEQLEPGCWLKIKGGNVEKLTYWDVSRTNIDFDFSNTTRTHQHTKELMLQSVKRRLVSDVPVGAFLSGGIDSSVVVGLMAEASAAPPNTFNISFSEKEFDESYYAGIVSKKFNTNHTNILLRPNIFLDELQNALDVMDTPTGDGINTYIVSKAIRQKGITVALSGIGGDELFAGYPIFSQYLRMQQKKWFWKLPRISRDLFSSFFLNSTSRASRFKQLLRLDDCSIEHAYPIFRQILSPRQLQQLTLLNANNLFISSTQKELLCRKQEIEKFPLLSQVSIAEYFGYTQHTLLKDTDQMSMAVALEVREPFFDQDLVEFVLAMPDELKKPVYPKSLLVESVKPLLPDEIVFRKKQGFLFPWNMWLRNELRTFCEAHIKNISERPFINSKQLFNFWKRFLQGDKNIRWAEIWLFVVLEYWLEKNNVQ
ncbi:MAG TPA: asparagine synthase (glutamine-hydrolyzing) [Puia sp.]|nr:asparagine synthase (glutamine-hydrolyzing) [Puia sp.]